MYKLHLILKYLRKRRIAWVSLIAVTLCTAMVLVVISVMGGWLKMFRESFHGIAGDIVVHGRSQAVGFPHYDEMIKRIEALPEVNAAAPVLKTYGVINIDNQIRQGVQVVGYPPNIGRVNGFTQSLYRLKATSNLDFQLRKDIDYAPPPGATVDPLSFGGMIVGGGLVGIDKDEKGKIKRTDELMSILPRASVTLTVLPVHPDSSLVSVKDSAVDYFWIIDDSRTGVYIYDSTTVYLGFDRLQENLDMTAHDGKAARTSDIQISLKPGANLQEAKEKIWDIVNEVRWEKVDSSARERARAEVKSDVGKADVRSALLKKLQEPAALSDAQAVRRIEGDRLNGRFPIQVQTWEEVHGEFIGAVENEKGLVTILFGIISLVAIFLIFCIFYMIVVEKTRDIGIIKSVGATSSGVAGIFLGYGLAIGICGSGLGLLVGWLIVHFINELHGWLANFGIVVWNPKVYLFDTIPNTLNPPEVTVIVAVAVVASVLGSLVPAIRAASMHPVEALRWE